MTRPRNLVSGFDSLNRKFGHRLIQSMTNVEEAHVILAITITFLIGGVPLILYALDAAAFWN